MSLVKFPGPAIYTCGLGWTRHAQSYYYYKPGAKFGQRTWTIVWEPCKQQKHGEN